MINLNKLADAFEERFDECTQYLNIKTGEAINVPNSPWTLGQEEYDQLQALVEDEDTYYVLPTGYELRDKPIMIDFAENYRTKAVSEYLLSHLHRNHPYRNFKDGVYKFGIEKEYYSFLHKAYVEIAREWCEGHGLEYSE